MNTGTKHTVDLTRENFDQVVGTEGMVLIDFWAAWCGPCRQFAPVFERAAGRHTDAVFAKVDTDAQTELAAAFEISSIPTLMIVRDGVILYAQPGALPETTLDKLIDQARAIDIEQVRRDMAAQGGAPAAGAHGGA